MGLIKNVKKKVAAKKTAKKAAKPAARSAQPKTVEAKIRHEYQFGTSVADLAEKYGKTTQEVLALVVVEE